MSEDTRKMDISHEEIRQMILIKKRQSEKMRFQKR